MRATSSSSRLPCRTSRPWRSESSGHHPPGSAHRLPEIAYDHLSGVRVEIAAADQAAQTQQSAHPSRIKIPKGTNVTRKNYFFNSIDPHRPFAARARCSAARAVCSYPDYHVEGWCRSALSRFISPARSGIARSKASAMARQSPRRKSAVLPISVVDFQSPWSRLL